MRCSGHGGLSERHYTNTAKPPEKTLMKKIGMIAATAVLVSTLLSSSAVLANPPGSRIGRDAPVGVDIDVRPPPPRAEVVPARRKGYLWTPGYWAWEGNRHVWVEGYWTRVRPGYVYSPGYWEQRGERWHYEPQRWEEQRRRQAYRRDLRREEVRRHEEWRDGHHHPDER